MEITTERTIIRYFRPEDGKGLYSYLSKENVCRYEPYEPYDRESALKEAQRRAGDHDFYAVTLHDGTLIGNLYFSARECETWELGYVFNDAYWGRGYACESAGALIDHAFRELGAHRVCAMCCPENRNSWRLMERLGMRREGVLLQNIYFKNNPDGSPHWLDTYEYGVLRSEWNKERK